MLGTLPPAAIHHITCYIGYAIKTTFQKLDPNKNKSPKYAIYLFRARRRSRRGRTNPSPILVENKSGQSNKYLKFKYGKWNNIPIRWDAFWWATKWKGRFKGWLMWLNWIFRWKNGASLFRIASEVARQVANVPLKQLKCLFFQRP
jgi:hypothetical protein